MAEEYGLKAWLELAVKNLKEVKKEVQEELKSVDLNAVVTESKLGKQGTAQAQGMLGSLGLSKTMQGVVGTLGAMLGVLYGIKKAADKMLNQMIRSSPYLQGMLSVLDRAKMYFWRPFGDMLGTLIKPLAIKLLKLSAKWMEFSRTPAGKVTTKALGGAMAGGTVGAGVGAVVGGLAGGPLGAVAGGAVGGILGSMIGATIALLKDALKGVKNIGIIIKAWLDYFVEKIFGINMDEVRAKVATFLYETLPNFFTKTLPEFFNNLWTKIKETGTKIKSELKDKLTGIWEGIKELGKYLWQGLTNKLSEAWETLKSFGQWLWDKVTNPFVQASIKLLNFGKWVWDTITKPLKTIKDNLSSLGTYLWNKITDALSSIWEKLKNIGTYMYRKVTNSIKEAFSGFKFGWSWWWKKEDSKQIGANYIPKEGLYYLHRGEKVLNPSQAQRETTNKTINFKPTFNVTTNGTGINIDSQIRSAARMLEFELRRRSIL